MLDAQAKSLKPSHFRQGSTLPPGSPLAALPASFLIVNSPYVSQSIFLPIVSGRSANQTKGDVTQHLGFE